MNDSHVSHSVSGDDDINLFLSLYFLTQTRHCDKKYYCVILEKKRKEGVHMYCQATHIESVQVNKKIT